MCNLLGAIIMQGGAVHRSGVGAVKFKRAFRIVLAILAFAAAAMLFMTYGTVVLSAPFSEVPLSGPVVADSNGEMTVIVDSDSRRALILDSNGELTGVVSCTTMDSPVDAITDVCISDGCVYAAGVRYEPDSDEVQLERVSQFGMDGQFLGTVFEVAGHNSSVPSIKSLSCALHQGLAISYSKFAQVKVPAQIENASEPEHQEETPGSKETIAFVFLDGSGAREVGSVVESEFRISDIALALGDESYYATLSERGLLDDNGESYDSSVYNGRVFVAVDISTSGSLYACDDVSGSLVVMRQGSKAADVLVEGSGYRDVHVNGDKIALCDAGGNRVGVFDEQGASIAEYSSVRPDASFSLRIVLVWLSAVYLVCLALFFLARTVIRMIKRGEGRKIASFFTAAAVVGAVGLAIGSMSLASYNSSLEIRAKEINACADYLAYSSGDVGSFIEGIGNRDSILANGEEFEEAAANMVEAAFPAMTLVGAANENDIGMYYSLYAKDDAGVYYLFGSSPEYVLGTSVRAPGVDGLEEAFGSYTGSSHDLRSGHTLRDATQYRLVQIRASEGDGVVGVIEIGSKMRSFESSLADSQAQLILGLLVMVLVVYLAHSEIRACGECVFSCLRRQKRDPAGSVAMLTRPFTLAVTMLSSVDSVMTVLIARDLLSNAGSNDASALLAVPAVMLGLGLVVGHTLYGALGRRVGLRKLVVCGALAVMACSLLTVAAVYAGSFLLYCVAKLVMSIPFGLLYTLGYSLPRLTGDPGLSAKAARDVKRTDTSAAALGTVLGGYVAASLGNVWVYVLVALCALPILLLALNLLPKGLGPLERLAQPDDAHGRVRDFVKTPIGFGLALFVVLPSAIAAGYASFLFPLFSADLGLSKVEINNVYVLGQLVVYVAINGIESVESRYGAWRASTMAVALLGAVFMLFAFNTTLLWSVAVVALVAVLCKVTYGWKAMWVASAREADVPAGRAVGALQSTNSLAMVAQPFIMAALVGSANYVAVIVIGVICALCALLFFLLTRRTSLAAKPGGARA